MSDRTRRARNLAAVTGAFAGVGAADADAQLTHYTDDMVLELPFAEPPVTLVGKDRARRFLRRAFEEYKMTLDITAVHECLDPDTLVVEFVSAGHMASTGKPYANTYIGVFRFRDGSIRAQKEFFNPLVADRAQEQDR